jgi:hypothetical protein
MKSKFGVAGTKSTGNLLGIIQVSQGHVDVMFDKRQYGTDGSSET